MNKCNQIPRVIHYCWFGGNPLPDFALRCIESWKKNCPDYEIIEWNESNYDVNSCAYIREAYQARKWAFVSDFARFDILYRYGGVYFDTDVELIRPIDDLLERGAFFGLEQHTQCPMINPGLGMAAAPGHPIYEKILSAYSGWHFLNSDGNYNQTTVVKYTTDILAEFGWNEARGIQCVSGIWIYPWDYFCPMMYETGEITLTENTRSIHHYSATWLTKEELAAHMFGARVSKRFGVKIGRALERIYSFPYRVRKKVELKGFWGAVKFALDKLLRKSISKDNT